MSGSITNVSTNSDGVQANGGSYGGVFSPDGTKVLFSSVSTNYIQNDTNGIYDVFIKDLNTGQITYVSRPIGQNATPGNSSQGSFNASFSPDGQIVIFASAASNLGGYSNNFPDIFTRNLTNGIVTRITAAYDGSLSNGDSDNPSYSSDGTKIVFESRASNLVVGDTNRYGDIFVKDVTSGNIKLVSVAADNTPANSLSQRPSFSFDGTKVLFDSYASNLTPSDTNANQDVFVKNIVTGAITNVSTTASGVLGNGFSTTGGFSPDGQSVVFSSNSTNFVDGDTNNASDIFVKNLSTGQISRISTSSDGNQSNGESYAPVFSPDGKSIAFQSYAANLTGGDTNGVSDVFVKNLVTGAVIRVSSFADSQSNGNSYISRFSPDGTRVIFGSDATNLSANDINSSGDLFVADLRTPYSINLPILSDSGISNTDKTTSFSKPTISGNAIAGSLVKIYDSGLVAGSATADNNGVYNVYLSAVLADGQHILTATGTPVGGSESAASSIPLIFNIDTSSPIAIGEISPSKPSSVFEANFSFSFSEVIYNFDPSDLTVKSNSGAVNGRIRSVAGNGKDFTVAVDKISGNGSFQIARSSMADASDAAGNIIRISSETSDAPSVTPQFLENFGFVQGWGSVNNPRQLADVDHSGSADYLAFGANYTFIASGGTFSDGKGNFGAGFASPVAAIHDFGTNQGYTADAQRGAAATGVGINTVIYGQGNAGIYYYDVQSQTSQTDAAGHTYAVPTYSSTPHLYADFGTKQGWTIHNGFQIVKASSSDVYTSVLGFGNNGIVVGEHAFEAAAPASNYVIPIAVGNSSGWDQTVDVRTFQDNKGNTLDLNHDGIADFLGMGPQGTAFAFGLKDSGGHFGLGQLQTATFGGSTSDLGRAQGWTDQNTQRLVVRNDISGYDDIFAFGGAGVYVAQGQDPSSHGGQPLGALHLGIADFGIQQGWSNDLTPRLVGDVNGDHIADIVGFGANSTFVALGSLDSAGSLHFALDPSKTINDFGYNEGWNSHTLRTLADVDGSGHDSLVLSGGLGTQIWHI